MVATSVGEALNAVYCKIAVNDTQMQRFPERFANQPLGVNRIKIRQS